MDFHVLLYRRLELVNLIQVHVVTATVGITFDQQRSLVDTVNDPVAGDTIGVAGNAGKGSVKVTDEDHISGD